MTFLTLFLGLISGSQSVALTAGPDVASIELFLDGGRVAHVEEPPWEAVVDLGSGLLPHHLEARGLDARGREVAAAEQWINLPRPPAEVAIVIDKAPAGRARTVQLTWRSLTNERPAAISLTLDGKSLALDGDGRATLPPQRDRNATHVLSAELRFSGGIAARRDLALGGEFGEEVSTDLTAFAVRLRKSGNLPPAARLRGWFTASGKPLLVSAVEAGATHLLVVRDPGAAAQLQTLGWFMSLSQHHFELRRGSRLGFVSPSARSFPGPGISSQLFAGSQEFDTGENGIPWLLCRAVQTGEEQAGQQRAEADQQLADAVAVAGLNADAGPGPRAVLVLLAGSPLLDKSRYDGPTVRRYLAAVHVPLFVWEVGPANDSTKTAWGAVEDISNWAGLDRAFHALKRELEAQRLVLVEGRHLPQSIALTPAAAVDLVP